MNEEKKPSTLTLKIVGVIVLVVLIKEFFLYFLALGVAAAALIALYLNKRGITN